MKDERGKRYYWRTREERLRRNKQWREANKERVKAKEFETRIRRKYGLTVQDYNNLLELQWYKCPICTNPFDSNLRKPCVDHDHKNKRVRWLLCQKCNKGIGLLDENLTTLSRAIKYLKSTS